MSDHVPVLLKHMVIAIWKEGKLKGNKRQRFASAWNIARSRLVEYGYFKKGGEVGPVERIQLTSKGVQREAVHRREPGSFQKSALFDEYYPWISTPAPKQNKSDNRASDQTERAQVADAARTASTVKPILNSAREPVRNHRPVKVKSNSRFPGKKSR